MASKIDIRPDHLEIVQNILREHLPLDVKIWVFGSRAKWSAKDYSDLDLALEGKEKIPSRMMIDLEYAFEESALPWKVDVLDINAISPEFRAVVEKDRVEFPQYTLSDVVSFVVEKISSSEISHNNYISTDNMLVDRGGIESAIKLPAASKFNNFQASDTLFSNIRTYFRKVWLANFDGGASPDVLIFRSKDKGILDPAYLYYIISDKAFADYTVLTAKGVKMPRGDKVAIMQYELHLPNINEQRSIAQTLLCLDNKIAINQQINQTLEEMAQACFKSWFVDFEPVRAKMVVLESGGSEEQANLAAMQAISGKTDEELQTLKFTDAEAYHTLHTTAQLFPFRLVDSELGDKKVHMAFDKIVKTFQEQIFSLEAEQETLTQIRDTLLPKLLSGEIDVSARKAGEVL